MSGRIGWILVLWATATCAQTNGSLSAPPQDSNLEQVCLSEILIKTPQPYDPTQRVEAQQKAEGLLERIRNGEKFEDIARKYSEGPAAAQGGELGAFKRGHLSKQIEDVVFAMKSGDVSDVIRARQAFVVLQVWDCAKIPASHAGSRTIEILSDTLGVDFAPYLEKVKQEIRKNWLSAMPESASLQRGRVAIEFRIAKDGQLDRIRIAVSSGQENLDRTAMQAITASIPFPPFPTEFTGDHLAVRFRFIYNPQRGESARQNESTPLSF